MLVYARIYLGEGTYPSKKGNVFPLPPKFVLVVLQLLMHRVGKGGKIMLFFCPDKILYTVIYFERAKKVDFTLDHRW